MKKIVAFLLAGCLALSLTACGQEPANQTDPAEETVYPACFDGMEALIAAARAEGALTVYGSCEESYLAAACQHFQELFGITVTYQRTAAGADVWFGGSAENCRAAAEAGQLMAYRATQNATYFGVCTLVCDFSRRAECVQAAISTETEKIAQPGGAATPAEQRHA